MIRSAPASVYGILNLFTSKSFKLSIKPPRLTSAKKLETIKIQNILGIILNYLILNQDYYYQFAIFIYQLSNDAQASNRLNYSLLLILFLINRKQSINPDITDITETIIPILQGQTIVSVQSQTLVVTRELRESNTKGSPSAIDITISKLSLQYFVIMSPWTVNMPSPATPNKLLIKYITIIQPPARVETIIVQTICEKRFMKSSTKRLFLTEDRSIIIPIGMLNKKIGRQVKKYIKLNSIVVKLYGSYLK